MAVNIQQSIFAEMADFLVTHPTLEALAAYKVSSGVQQHIDDLLERNREEGLSSQERLELENRLFQARYRSFPRRLCTRSICCAGSEC